METQFYRIDKEFAYHWETATIRQYFETIFLSERESTQSLKELNSVSAGRMS